MKIRSFLLALFLFLFLHVKSVLIKEAPVNPLTQAKVSQSIDKLRKELTYFDTLFENKQKLS
jgi:hypothetical protein